MNNIIICGNLTKDAEIKQLDGEHSLTKFSVAVQRRYKKEDGSHDTDFFNCTCFGKLGTEVVAKYTKKGSKIIVSGRMESSTKENDDGTKSTYWNLIVEDVELIGSGNLNTAEQPKADLQPIDDKDNPLPF